MRYIYDAWGNCAVEKDINTIAYTNPLRYRGYYYDSDTDMYYLQSRYYDAKIGRFINADDSEMLFEDQGTMVQYNLFAYCGNNPVINIDPTGYGKTYVFYYCGNKSLVEQAKNSPYFNRKGTNVHCRAMFSIKTFIKDWNSMSGQIDAVYLYLHGDPGRLNFQGKNQYLTTKKHHDVKYTFDDLKPKKIKNMIYLFSCFGGKEAYIGSCYMGCVGKILSKKNNCTVLASTGGVSYSKAANGKYYARPGLKPSKIGQWIKFYPGKSIFGNPKICQKKLGWYILV